MNRTPRKIQPTGHIMHRVSLALLPGALAMAWQYGAGVIWNLLWLVALCALVEIVCSSLRHGISKARRQRFELDDGTTLLAALLIGICLPPSVSPAILCVAALAAIGLAKHAYGGLGQNIFNPAMAGLKMFWPKPPYACFASPMAASAATHKIAGDTEGGRQMPISRAASSVVPSSSSNR